MLLTHVQQLQFWPCQPTGPLLALAQSCLRGQWPAPLAQHPCQGLEGQSSLIQRAVPWPLATALPGASRHSSEGWAQPVEPKDCRERRGYQTKLDIEITQNQPAGFLDWHHLSELIFIRMLEGKLLTHFFPTTRVILLILWSMDKQIWARLCIHLAGCGVSGWLRVLCALPGSSMHLWRALQDLSVQGRWGWWWRQEWKLSHKPWILANLFQTEHKCILLPLSAAMSLI